MPQARKKVDNKPLESRARRGRGARKQGEPVWSRAGTLWCHGVTRSMMCGGYLGDGDSGWGRRRLNSRVPIPTGGGGVRTLLRKTKNKTYSAIRVRKPSQLSLDQSPVGLPVQRSKSNGSGDSHVCTEPPRANSWDEVTTQQPGAGFVSYLRDYHDHSTAAEDEGMKTIVRTLEGVLRKALICCVIFIAGTMFPQLSSVASHLMELSFVAWATCLLIVILGRIQGNRRQNNTSIMHNDLQTPYSQVDIESQSLEQSLIPGTTGIPAQPTASREMVQFDQEEQELQAERQQIPVESLYIMSKNERIIPKTFAAN
ncbi:hypothetical protein THAOC_14622 [Thalassiosira oceanica]|uniref:Uncharacterized protein n=1 Tax=Thalassiosira oceanica TaxID=159749 RepID=K0SGZ9_THAOC|nr:hypothetical protein THAOC_14622 [Thalassiosira oceanica]|eukprot:EJK64625.1 hypothetical protein THAOC_14622 [Thalassiosira oceanica]